MTGEQLALRGGQPVSAVPITVRWPRITESALRAMVTQASESLSIYDRSGIVKEFERAFGSYVGAPYTVATSSGTAALHSAYYGARLGPGDEVVCCDYGFFITVTPLVHLGATPVFVDCEPDGTISVDQAAAAITGRTRAVVVTHMFGQPGRLRELRALCDQRGILLIEDCSHAHGATYHNEPAGSFGDAAVWSLQAKKTIWAGEGGVLCTRHADVYERALLLGHFNMRALQDIPESSPNHALAFTGTGLKYRAHPLGLAVATPQIAELDTLIKRRQEAAAQIVEALRAVPGVELVGGSTDTVTHGYYALPATVDPARAGFDRATFVAALEAENVFTADIPRQMGTMSHYDVFGGGRLVHDGVATTDPGRLDHSRRLTDQLVKFFVPGHDDDLASLDFVTEAIMKIGRLLGGVR